GSGPDDYWAAGGDAAGGMLVHGSRAGWSTPISIPNSYDIRGVLVLSPTDAWGVGNDAANGIAVHWDGNRWSAPISFGLTVQMLLSIWQSDASNVWAAGGGYDYNISQPVGVIVHWTGGWGSTPEIIERQEVESLSSVWAAPQ